MLGQESSMSPDTVVSPSSSSRREKENEFARLRSVLPSISASRNSVPRINVLEEAIKYIAHLQASLENQSVNLTTEEVQRRFRESSVGRLNRAKKRKVASFHAKFKTAPKPRRLKALVKKTKQKR